MAAESVSRGLVNRMSRALALDKSLYEEVEADKSATGQAMLVVVAASVIGGLGAAATGGVLGLLAGILLGIAGWAIWAWLNYFIGTRLLAEPQTEADWGQLARTMGFAYSPRIFLLLMLIPFLPLQIFVSLAVVVWVAIGMVIAVRQALDYRSTLRAVAVTVVGLLINAIAVGILAAFLPAIGTRS